MFNRFFDNPRTLHLWIGIFFVTGDLFAIWSAALFGTLLLNSFAVLELNFPLRTTLLFSTIAIFAMGFFRLYQVKWRFTGIRELLFILLGLTIAFVLTQTVLLLTDYFSNYHFSYSLVLYSFSILFVGGFRISKRMVMEVLRAPVQRKRAVIFGAGNAADQLMRDFTRHHHWSIQVVAIFDDNVKLHGLNLHGIRILGDRNKMYTFLRYSDIDELIIAIPSMSKSELKKISDKVHESVANLKVKVLPSYHIQSAEPVGFNDVRRISIEDVLGREPVRANTTLLETSIQNKHVLITGAGGSIGSEIIKQCLKLSPAKVIALDVDETELFYLGNDYAHLKDQFEPCVANVTDRYKMRQVFERFKPDIIFHAAAYKHVPMMEKFPEEAIKVNIGGTRLISELSCEYGVEKFVLISTDKAVNPTNVMGATKRVAEEVCLAFNKKHETRFIAVRFGNVLGSRGSVVPLFLEQIRNGGPVTITHKDVKRYFMTIPEAVLLVMHAGFMGKGGEVFLLDMGEPVRILDMAKQLIKLHGLQPDVDVKIEFTGLRPGEKMFEELTKYEEILNKTEHELINKVSNHNGFSETEMQLLTDQLLDLVNHDDYEKARILLKKLVPSYQYKVNVQDLKKEVI